MSIRRRPASADDGRSLVVKSLPLAPSLEFERKQAKALLRALHDGDPDALERLVAAHPKLRSPTPESSAELQLADAQLVIAREYGFASWPRLVHYFAALERDAKTDVNFQLYPDYEGWAKSIVAEHGARRVWAARSLAGQVPRFYGMTVEEVFAASVTLEDAKIAVAREYRCSTWEQLMERADAERRFRENNSEWNRESQPLVRAREAARARDIEALEALVTRYPELSNPSPDDERRGTTLVNAVIQLEHEASGEDRFRVSEWLMSNGVDVQTALNRALVQGGGLFEVEYVRYLLARGADPTWMPPNGVSVLEHALLRYHNREAVDLLAARVTPRRALWIAAGLGDVESMRTFFDESGRPTAEAYRDRPPLDVSRRAHMPLPPDPDDQQILMEVAIVAMENDRPKSIEVLMDHGLRVDTLEWGMSLVTLAVGNGHVEVAEVMIGRGANLDVKGWRPSMTTRDMAKSMFLNDPTSAKHRRLLELCGGDPDQLLAESDANRPEPQFAQRTVDALNLAGDDAARRAQSVISPENILVGLLRVSDDFIAGMLRRGGVDITRLREQLGERLLPSSDKVERGKLPLNAEAQAAVRRAAGRTRARRRDHVFITHMLGALLDDEGIVRWLSGLGGTLDRITLEVTSAE
jgi:hypothetical protein